VSAHDDAPAIDRERGWWATIALGLVRAYQVVLSPLVGGGCRFTPSCSAYAIEAIERHGARRGSWLAMTRVARCHPWGGAGLDPVPSLDRGERQRQR
jgi:putative membrane protein insertion efficiency factor